MKLSVLGNNEMKGKSIWKQVQMDLKTVMSELQTLGTPQKNI